MSNISFVPYHRASIGEEEIEGVVATLRSGWLTTGPRTVQFETEFRDYVQAPYSLAVSSCTAGLHLALAALGIGPGDEVITTPMTFSATVAVIIQVGAKPVLADIGPDGNIDPASIIERITERTKAIIPVHLAGLPCRMDEIWRIAKQHKLYVVEDAAHAIGSHFKGNPIGAAPNATQPYASDAVAFSFYATKNLTTGEGGMVTTPSTELNQEMRLLCLHGISRDAWNRYADKGNWFYEVVRHGFKYNLSDIQSAIGIPQLRRQEEFQKKRAECAELYNEAFGGMEELELPPTAPDTRHAWHLYSIRLHLDRLQIDRGTFIQELNQKGVGTSVHFIPIPLHPYYAPMFDAAKDCPRALELYPRLISLPLYPGMTPEQVSFVVAQVKDIIAAQSKQTKVSYTYA
jgi:dTDP-4-amino-4,6-dideoxygalactose transaminase